MEIILNGEIESAMLDLFNSLPDDEITVKLNSYGGDIGTALAIYKRLHEREGVTVEVEGIAASAATLIACAGKCRMAANALYMIHSPMIELYGNYNRSAMETDIEALLAIESQMLKIYAEKTWLDEKTLEEMMISETWLTANEAKSKGFVDEITGAYVPAEEDIESQTVNVNGVIIPLGRFTNKAPLKMMASAVKPAFAVAPAERQNVLDQFLGLFKSRVSAREEALLNECNRLRIELLRAQDELGKAQAREKAANAMYTMIIENATSGASKVQMSTAEAADKKAETINKVVSYANRGR